LKYGCSGMQGYRETMEDYCNSFENIELPEHLFSISSSLSFFSIFDGHGGTFLNYIRLSYCKIFI
jgi:serine/threonine protein phosphatase PrpC